MNADKSHLHTIITNLLSNAIKYSPNNTVIQISTKLINDKTRVSIINKTQTKNGLDVKNIWDRFYRGNDDRNKSIEGSGLGLSIVKTVFEMLEFDYEVEQEKGSITFWFEIQVLIM